MGRLEWLGKGEVEEEVQAEEVVETEEKVQEE